MGMTDALLPEFDREVTTTRKLLERLPWNHADWKPHDKSMSLGQLAGHVATLPLWGSMTLTRSDLDLGEGAPAATFATADDLLATFDRQVAEARAALVTKTDAELMAPWTLKRNGQTIFSMPKAVVWRSFVMNHLVHHRGQLSVYLRMRDVALPAIYGPSADEGPF